MPMEPSIVAEGWDEAVVKHRRAVAQRVIAAFGSPLPELRVLIYLDATDCGNLRAMRGGANRGIHFPVKVRSVREYRLPIPMYLLLDERLTDGVVTFAFDSAIYIYNSTCLNEVGLTMTLAHEFQHFMQYGFKRRAWAANMLAMNLSLQTIRTLGFTWADIATEHEARIVSKRIAERLCGPERVREYIELRKSQPADADDANDWAFVQAIDVSREFDLELETQKMYRRIKPHRQEITDRLLEALGDPDFADLGLMEFFGESAAAVAAA